MRQHILTKFVKITYYHVHWYLWHKVKGQGQKGTAIEILWTWQLVNCWMELNQNVHK